MKYFRLEACVIIENEPGDLSSNSGRVCLCLTWCKPKKKKKKCNKKYCPYKVSQEPVLLYAVQLIKLVTLVEGDQKSLFSIATILRCRGERYSIPWIAPRYP